MRIKPIIDTAFKFLFSKTNNVKLKNIILGLAFSMVPVIIVLIVSEGMIFGITQRFIEINSYHYQIKKHFSFSEEQFESVKALLAENNKVTGIFREKRGEGLLNFNKSISGVSVRGVEKSFYKNDPKLREFLKLKQGNFDLSDDRNIILSADLAEEMDIKVGDKLKLLTTKPTEGRPPILRPNTFIVSAIVYSGYYDLDNLTVYMSYEKAVRLFPDNQSIIGVKVKNPSKEDAEFEEYLDEKLNLGWYYVYWKKINALMYSSFASTESTLLIIMSIIIIVAAVNIFSALVMLTMEKSREIAIMKSTGISNNDIVVLFSFMSVVIGIIGTFAGIAIGLFLGININPVISIIEYFINSIIFLINILITPFSNDIAVRDVKILNPSYYLEKIPVIIDFAKLTIFCSFAIFLSFLAGFIPGIKASKRKPVEIIAKHI